MLLQVIYMMNEQKELLEQIAFDEKRGLLPEGYTEKIRSELL